MPFRYSVPQGREHCSIKIEGRSKSSWAVARGPRPEPRQLRICTYTLCAPKYATVGYSGSPTTRLMRSCLLRAIAPPLRYLAPLDSLVSGSWPSILFHSLLRDCVLFYCRTRLFDWFLFIQYRRTILEFYIVAIWYQSSVDSGSNSGTLLSEWCRFLEIDVRDSEGDECRFFRLESSLVVAFLR